MKAWVKKYTPMVSGWDLVRLGYLIGMPGRITLEIPA
jgi:hypothetical protein